VEMLMAVFMAISVTTSNSKRESMS
jgi:hypothetical protein